MKAAHIDAARFGPWAVVTGASSGIGEEFARQLAANKINVALVARRLPVLETLGRDLAERYGVSYRAVDADLSEPGFLDRLTDATDDLDVGLLVSNAGTVAPGEFLNQDLEALRYTVRLNAIAHLELVHHFGQRLASRGRGGMVLVSASGAVHGVPYMANVAAAKAYVYSLGEGLNTEFARHGVNLSVLLPGPTDTPALDAFGFARDRSPIKPMPVRQCVAEALTALAANHASHVAGRLNRIMTGVVPPAITRNLMARMLSQQADDRHPRTTAPSARR